MRRADVHSIIIAFLVAVCGSFAADIAISSPEDPAPAGLRSERTVARPTKAPPSMTRGDELAPPPTLDAPPTPAEAEPAPEKQEQPTVRAPAAATPTRPAPAEQEPPRATERADWPKQFGTLVPGGPGSTASIESFGTVLLDDGVGAVARLVLHVVTLKPDGQTTYRIVEGPKTTADGRYNWRVRYNRPEDGETYTLVTAKADSCNMCSVATPDPDQPAELRLPCVRNNTRVEGDVVDTQGDAAAGRSVICWSDVCLVDTDGAKDLPGAVREVIRKDNMRKWNHRGFTDELGHFVVEYVPKGPAIVWCGSQPRSREDDCVELEVAEGISNRVARPLLAK